MALLQRGRYKRDKLEPLLIPLVTEVLTHLPENPAQFMLDQLSQHVAHKPGKNLAPDNNPPIRDDGGGVATTDGKHMQTETEIDMEAQREKKLADVMKLSEKQEEMLQKLTNLLAIRDKTILNYKEKVHALTVERNQLEEELHHHKHATDSAEEDDKAWLFSAESSDVTLIKAALRSRIQPSTVTHVLGTQHWGEESAMIEDLQQLCKKLSSDQPPLDLTKNKGDFWGQLADRLSALMQSQELCLVVDLRSAGSDKDQAAKDNVDIFTDCVSDAFEVASEQKDHVPTMLVLCHWDWSHAGTFFHPVTKLKLNKS